MKIHPGNFKRVSFTIIAILLFVIGVNFVYSWTAPAGTPPTLNAAVPVNVGPNTQIKTGSLGIDGNFSVSGNSVFKGKVRIADGTQGSGKYLTSDSLGNASWKPLP